MTLMVFGVLGSIITIHLLQTSELQMEIQRPGAKSNSNERPPIPPSPVNSTTEIPTATLPQNPISEQIDQILKSLESETDASQQNRNEISEISTRFPTEIDDISLNTQLPVSKAEQDEVTVTDSSPIAKMRDGAHQSRSSSPGGMIKSILSQSQIEPAIDPERDCPPLFSVTFKHNSIQPSELDLNEKAQKLQEWLSRHPQSILLIDGHTDSSGPEELNIQISSQRADIIYELLAKSGIAKDQMGIRAFGEFAPLHGIPTDFGNNRRVFLRIEGVDVCPESQEYGDLP